MNETECRNKSVGILVFKGEDLLLIERSNFPFGFAPPAGHVEEGQDFEDAAVRELKEEVGLDSSNLVLVGKGRKDTPCKRGGTWHDWKIYRAEVKEGNIQRSLEETVQASFFKPEEILNLLARTDNYIRKQINDELWRRSPGIEVVWAEWFKEMGIPKNTSS